MLDPKLPLQAAAIFLGGICVRIKVLAIIQCKLLSKPDHEEELSWAPVLWTCGVVSGDRLHHSGYQSHNEAQREAYDTGATALLTRDGEEHTAKVRC